MSPCGPESGQFGPQETLDYGVKVAFHRGDKHGLPHWRVMTNATGVRGMPISRTEPRARAQKWRLKVLIILELD
eukprot:s1077_g22.t1